MRKFSALTAVVVLSAGLVTGCGGGGGSSSSSDYCKELKSSAASIKSLTGASTPDFTKLADFVDRAHKIADKAPSELKDDWTTLLAAMNTLTSALSDAGLKLEDLGQLMAGQVPEGVDTSKLAGLSTKLQEIGSDKVTKAADAISKHAKDTCKVKLG